MHITPVVFDLPLIFTKCVSGIKECVIRCMPGLNCFFNCSSGLPLSALCQYITPHPLICLKCPSSNKGLFDCLTPGHSIGSTGTVPLVHQVHSKDHVPPNWSNGQHPVYTRLVTLQSRPCPQGKACLSQVRVETPDIYWVGAHLPPKYKPFWESKG
jgi:hypothetical protein